jgi:hypothetical protein
LKTYEKVALFCLKLESIMQEHQADEFGKQIAQMFSKIQ